MGLYLCIRIEGLWLQYSIQVSISSFTNEVYGLCYGTYIDAMLWVIRSQIVKILTAPDNKQTIHFYFQNVKYIVENIY